MRKLFSKIVIEVMKVLEVPKLNKKVTVRFPGVWRCYRLRVSSVKFMTFTARFEGDEPAGLDVYDRWGQKDNDIVFHKTTREPIDMRENH